MTLGFPDHSTNPDLVKEVENKAEHEDPFEQYYDEGTQDVQPADGGTSTQDPNMSPADAAFPNNPAPQQASEPAPDLPPDFQKQVDQERTRLFVDSGVTGIGPKGSSVATDADQFDQQAQVNVLKNYQQQKAADLIDTQNKAAQLAAKTASDNQVLAQAGLPLIQSPGADTQAQVSPQNQVSLAPKSQQQPSGPNIQDPLAQFQKGEQESRAGISQQANVQGQMAQQNAKDTQDYIEMEKQRQAGVNAELQKINAQNDQLFQAARNQKIDPNRFWNNLSTPGKISAAVGLIFGGLGSGITHQTNTAAAFMEHAISNDIDAQKNDQTSAVNMYKLGLDKYRNTQDAAAFATLQAHALLKAQIDLTAAKLGTAQAEALKQQAFGSLDQKDAPLKSQLAVSSYGLKLLNSSDTQQQSRSGGAPELINHNRWIALKATGQMSEGEEASATKEAENLIKGEALKAALHDSFNKLNTLGAGHFSPGLREAEMDALSGPLAKVSEGRFNKDQAKIAIDAIMPQAKDIFTPELRAIRAKKLDELVDSAVSTPTLNIKRLRINRPTFTPGKPQI